MLLLALLAAAQDVPRLGPSATFADWLAGCDNSGFCEVTALARRGTPSGQADPDNAVEFSVWRDAGKAPVVRIDRFAQTGVTVVSIDGVVLARKATDASGAIELDGPTAGAIVRAMATGSMMTIAEGDGTPLDMIPLASAADALGFIEAARVAAASGSRAKAIRLVEPEGEAAAIDDALRTTVTAMAQCTIAVPEEQWVNSAQFAAPIARGTTMLMVPCRDDAANYWFLPIILRGGKAEIARFDYPPVPDAPRLPMGPTIWQRDAGQLSISREQTGLELRSRHGCRQSQKYRWDGAMFRLQEVWQMPDCDALGRGVRIWHVELVTG